MKRVTSSDVLAEAHRLIGQMDRVRPDVHAERLAAFEQEYAKALEIRDAAAAGSISAGLRQRHHQSRAT